MNQPQPPLDSARDKHSQPINRQGLPGRRPSHGRPLRSYTSSLPTSPRRSQPIQPQPLQGTGRPPLDSAWGQPQLHPHRQVIGRAPFEGVRAIFLGGLGEIGKNMLALESGSDIIVIDCGVMFPKEDMLGIDLVIPDTRYLEERKHLVRGYFLTHGHEDHISGLPFIWPKVPAPVYGTRLTLAFLEAKLEEFGLDKQVPLKPMKVGDRIQAGVFNVEPVRVNHSIPDAVALAVRTPEGIILDTGDWKIDHTPVSGDAIDFPRLADLAKEGITLLLSDSTGVVQPGYTMSEKKIGENLEVIFKNAAGRIIIASFASQVNRLQQILDAAAKYRRKVAVSGRSLERNINIALKYGYIKAPENVLADIRNINRLPDSEVVIMATGAQGEQYSALVRMSTGEHRHIRIKPGDTVILSASVIPGNESSVAKTINNLYREGAEVFQGKDYEVHVSGHGGQEELKMMIAMTRPKFFVPIHGEFNMLVKHARLAQSVGVEAKNIFVAEDGDFVELKGGSAKLVQNKVEASYVLVDGSGIGDVGNIVLRDRQAMAQDGIFMVILTLEKTTGKLRTSPDIISRGFVYMRAAEDLIYKTRQEVRTMFTRLNERYPKNWEQVKRHLREELSEYLYTKTQRRPMVIPVVIEV